MSQQTIETNPHMTDERRDELAEQAVTRFSAWSAAAGVIPVPFVDMLAVGGVQIQMLRTLAEIYGVPFSDNIGKSILATTLGSVIPAGVAAPAASMLKFVPVIGTAVASITMPVVSAGATYALGKVFIQHFASGGTLLDFDPGEYREFMKRQTNK